MKKLISKICWAIFVVSITVWFIGGLFFNPSGVFLLTTLVICVIAMFSHIFTNQDSDPAGTAKDITVSDDGSYDFY